MSFHRRSENVTNLPAPFQFPPSGTFDGNDGAWSTFIINVGDNSADGHSGQNFKVLISTSGSFVTLPYPADWCNQPDQASCAEARGVETPQSLGFTTSASWQQIGIYNFSLLENVELYPDLYPKAIIGRDAVGLGPDSTNSSILQNQLVAQLNTEDFFMGSFGLSTFPPNYEAGPINTFLTNFNAFNATPSLTYGYTAGAKYRNENKGVPASLTLGGYDQSRFTTESLSIPMTSDNHSLVVGVQSITYVVDPSFTPEAGSPTANTVGFVATIDSTLPYLWLPDSICDWIADHFRLTYDNVTNLYTVNDTSHDYNVNKQNATLQFTLVVDANPNNDFVSIVLPYAALDLTASFPIYDNATKYFPLKRSATGNYILGRAFLQEAFLIVDYERNNFTIAPANFTDPMPEAHIVTIHSTSYVPPSPPKHSGLSTAAIAGIVVGVVVLILVAIGVAIRYFLRRRKQKRAQQTAPPPSEIDTMIAGHEVKRRRVSELDSNPSSPPPRFSAAGGYFGDQVRGDNKDREPPIVEIPILNELESPPQVSEMESPPTEGATPAQEGGREYFPRWRRDGKGRSPSGTLHELPGDDGQFQVHGMHFEPVGNFSHSRGNSGGSVSAATTPGMGSPVSPEALRPLPLDYATPYATPFEEPGQLRSSTVPTRTSTVSTAIGSETPTGHRRDYSQVSSSLGEDLPAGHRRDPSNVSSNPSSPTAEEMEAWALGKGIDERSVSRDRRGKE